MAAMLERITEPTSYQAFQHFITHAPWEAEVVWRCLRAVVPAADGHGASGVDQAGTAAAECPQIDFSVARNSSAGTFAPE
jgi:DDE superfamily endonuclease